MPGTSPRSPRSSLLPPRAIAVLDLSHLDASILKVWISPVQDLSPPPCESKRVDGTPYIRREGGTSQSVEGCVLSQFIVA